MNQHEILTKLNGFKGNLQQLLITSVHKFKGRDEQSTIEESANDLRCNEEGIDHYIDDLPLTLSRDPCPGIKY